MFAALTKEVTRTHRCYYYKKFARCSYPLIENPYAMDLHESPVTAAVYLPGCAPDLIPALYSVGAKQMQQKRAGYSTKVRQIP